jgi:hypothetical protein
VNFRFSIFGFRFWKSAIVNRGSAVLLVVAGFGSSEAAGNETSSLSDLDIEFTEAKLTLEQLTRENASLRQQLDLAQAQAKSLTEALAIANSEAEVFKRGGTEMKLRMEALGIDAAAPEKAKLEQRLLKAVSDLQIVQKEKDKLADHLVRIDEAILHFLKSAVSTDPEARMAIEIEMRSANEALGLPSGQAVEAKAVPATLTDGMVISVKEEYALVIANLGSREGVKVGMPFQVWRGETRVGSVTVVDVREKISGAVIQDLNPKEKVRVGDRLRVDAQR